MISIYTTPKLNLSIQQSGMVSLVITLIMMIVISITVLGFSQVARRDQRQALDKQLSSQAYYAAESGVNAATSIIYAKLASGAIPPDKTDCTSDVSPGDYKLFPPLGNNVIDAATNTSYTCVLIDASPPDISYDISSTGASKVIPIKTSGALINTLNLSWTPDPAFNSPLSSCNNASNSQPAVVPNAPATTAWSCKYGVIRIDLVPTGNLDRVSMLVNTFSGFLAPEGNGPPLPGAGTVSYAPGPNVMSPFNAANQGARPAAICDDNSCTISITGMTANSYYARISSIYRDTKVTISATNGATTQELVGVQALVDSTGRSQDVLKRIQVRVPLINNVGGLHNDYAIESTNGICKTFFSFPNYPNNNNYCSD